MAITRSQNKRRKTILIADDVVVVGDRRGGGGSPDWLLLPPEILHCVVERLDCAVDLFSFSSVCRDWRTAGLASRPRRLLSSLLFFSSGLQTFRKPQKSINKFLSSDNGDDDVDGGIRRFFSLSRNKGFRLQLPLDIESKWWCVGSSYGWLILVDKRIPLYSDIQLFNPFAAEKNAWVRLPPIMPDSVEHVRYIARRAARKGFSSHLCHAVDRAFLSCNPQLTTTDNVGGEGESSSWNNSCMVLVFCFTELLLCRPGDDRWKHIECCARDAISFQGRLYVVAPNGSWGVYDVDYSSLPSIGDFPVQQLVPSAHFPPLGPLVTVKGEKYLVQSSGELLMVIRRTEWVSDPLVAISDWRTLDFSLFRLNRQRWEWTEVPDIGDDRTIFVGNSKSMCLSSHDHPGWKTNCIYFVIDRKCPCQPKSIQEAGVFDLKQRTISLFGIGGLRRHDILFWFTPNMNWG